MTESQIKVIAIAAMDEGRVIGLEQGIPWHIPGEQKRFAQLTKGHTVVMGRKTYQSLPENVRPLPERKNIIFSKSPRSADWPDEVEHYQDVDDFFSQLKTGSIELPSDIVWVIGGEIIYRKTLQYCDEICLTLVKGKHEGDAFFPEFESEFVLGSKEDSESHSYHWYKRRED